MCAMVIIMANSFLIGWMSDYHMNHGEDSYPLWAKLSEICLVGLFTLEVALKLIAYSVNFFCVDHWRWNVFDLILVVQGILGAIALDKNLIWNGSFLRVLRMVRILRLLRIIHIMQELRELRLMTHSMIGSAKAMVWTMALLLGVNYMFGTFFVQACALCLDSIEHDEELVDELKRYWGSLLTSMDTLFKASTGGEDWAFVAAPLYRINRLVYITFLLYMAFFLFAVTNAITSLFVEATMHRATQDSNMAIHFEMEKKDTHIANLQSFFSELDIDDDGLISYMDFAAVVGDPRLVAFATSLGIDVYDAKVIFEILSGSLSSSLDLETFVIGCIKMRGDAKAVDMYVLFDTVQKRIHDIENKLNHMIGAQGIPVDPTTSSKTNGTDVTVL